MIAKMPRSSMLILGVNVPSVLRIVLVGMKIVRHVIVGERDRLNVSKRDK